MQFTIYSIGDAAFLEQILNSVAMICGTNNLKQVVAIGLMLGFIFIVVQSIFEGAKQINIQHVFMGWVMYAVFYGPSCTIKIEDVYSGQVRVVSNVPIGVGMAGGVVSNIGYGITSLFEQGFQISGGNVSNAKYNESLKLLSETRRQMYNNAVFASLDASLGGGYVDTKQSWINYIKECTLIKVDLNQISLTKLMTEDISTSLKFDSRIFGTRLYLKPGVNGTDYTCTDAWVQLLTSTSNLASGALSSTLNAILNIDSTSGFTASGKLNESLQMLGLSSLSANSYVKLALLEPLYNEASMSKYQDMQDYSSALMVNQAIQQRNTQWAGEQTLFMTTVRPLVTFFEGFVYALTPIMAFIIVLGGMGIKLIGRYIQMILWIQLWLPVLAITNLYIYMASREELIAITYTGTSSIESFYALNTTADKLDTWIATGGMLASATPLIALFIITGSSYAFTTLSSRLGGADHINEKIPTPDAVQKGPVMADASEFSFNSHSGALRTGTESLIGSYSIGQNMNSSLSSASEQMKQSSSVFAKNLSNAITENSSSAETYSKLSNLGKTVSSMNTVESQAIQNQAKQFMQQNNISDQHSDAVVGSLALQASGGASVGVGVQAGVSGAVGAQAKTQDGSTYTSADISNFAKNNSLSDNQKSAFSTQLAGNISKQDLNTLSKTYGDSISNSLMNSASELVSSADKYSQLEQLSSSLGTATTADFKTLGASVASNPESSRFLNDNFQFAPQKVKDEAANLQDIYMRNGIQSNIAQQMARMSAMTNPNNFSNSTEQLSSLGAVTKSIGLATGKNLGLNGNPLSNSGGFSSPHQALKGTSHQFGDATNAANSIIGQDRTFNDMNLSSSNMESLHEDYKNNKQNVKGNATAVSTSDIKKAESGILNSSPPMGTAARLYGATDNAGGYLSRNVDRVGGAISTAYNHANNNFSNAVNSLGSMTSEQRKSLQNDIENGKNSNLAKYGSFWGSAANIGGSIKNSAVGMTVSGYNAAKDWITGESSSMSGPANDMSLEEKGAYYTGAFAAAVESGTDKAAEFFEQHGTQFKDTLSSIAQQRYGLTSKQAAIYAESFDTNPQKMSSAINSLKEDYAERDENGEILRNGNGSPVLSDYYEKFTDKMVSDITASTNAGDRSGSYLNNIRNYNTTIKSFE